MKVAIEDDERFLKAMEDLKRKDLHMARSYSIHSCCLFLLMRSFLLQAPEPFPA